MAKKKEGTITFVAPPKHKLVEAFCKAAYYDVQLERNVYYGEIVAMSEERAKELEGKGLVTITE